MSKKRQRLQLDERREQLLEIGLQVFTEASYESVSIDHIASTAGVSKGLLYHYFGGKKAFYVACVRRAAHQMVEAIRPDPNLPPPARAWTALNAYLDFVEARSEVFTTLLQGGQGVDPEVVQIVADTREAFAAQVLDGTGTTDSAAFQLAAFTYVGAAEAASVAWLRDRSVSREALVYSLMCTLHAIMVSAATIDPTTGFEVDDAMTIMLATMKPS